MRFAALLPLRVLERAFWVRQTLRRQRRVLATFRVPPLQKAFRFF
jgi:hypothetical protein